MKELVLIRHAKSSWSDINLSDFDRPLNKRGKKNAPFMAKILKELVKNPDFIISSPSKRTKSTLNYFIKEFDIKKDKIIYDKSIYEAHFSNILKSIKEIKKENNIIFVIGHNPGLNELTNYLIGNFKDNIPTCGILKIVFDINSWDEIEENSGKLEFFKYPKMLII